MLSFNTDENNMLLGGAYHNSARTATNDAAGTALRSRWSAPAATFARI